MGITLPTIRNWIKEEQTRTADNNFIKEAPLNLSQDEKLSWFRNELEQTNREREMLLALLEKMRNGV